MFKAGITVRSRFGPEWQLLSDVDGEGWAHARRVEDGEEREIHISDIAGISAGNGTAPTADTVGAQ